MSFFSSSEISALHLHETERQTNKTA